MREYHAQFEPERFYHIYNRGNNSEIIYANRRNYNYFLSKWIKYVDPYAKTFAYCLMPNHFHFLLKINSQNSFDCNGAPNSDINKLLEGQFKRLFSSYALSYNKEHKRHGSLFEKRFNRVVIDSDVYLSKIIHYIHNNPIHHGLTKNYTSWKFSSYSAILSNNSTRVAREEVLNWFGGREAYIHFHDQNINFNKICDVAIDSF
ncbi:MAG: transposase [Candidatus Cyclobacteriaceae bacterium M2_1C_046]